MTQYSTEQYNFALARIEALLPYVTDQTPKSAPEAIELSIMSEIVIAYEEQNYPLETLTTSQLIRIGLEEKSKTQKELARELGISPSRVSDFINGRGEPSLNIAGKICRILDIRPELMLSI